MELDFRAFAFIVSLAAVVNGLGIVRWLTATAEYLRRRHELNVRHYWVFSLAAAFQFLLHILLWWSLWGIRGTTTLNFLTYLYLLAGPVLLYLGTSLLVPDVDNENIDVESHYFAARPTYTTVLILVWIWAIFLSPVLNGVFAPTWPMFTAFLAIALLRRMTDKPWVHSTAAIVNWILLAVFVGLYQMQLGGTSVPGN